MASWVDEKTMRKATRKAARPWLPWVKRLVVLLLCAAAFYVALAIGHANTGRAADRPNTTLDNIATEIAGHPVHVWCEGDYADWHTSAMGWTIPPQYGHTVYVHPAICDYLWKLLDPSTDRSQLALNWIANSVHALVHESVHQMGGEYANCYENGPTDYGCEARTDCKALTLDEGVLVKYFGYKITTQPGGYKLVPKFVKRHGKRVRILKRVNLPDLYVEEPALTQILAYTWMLHKSLPPQYQGVC